ncbi:MAG: nucleoside deaminase [Alphaproteobacteria bacterium]
MTQSYDKSDFMDQALIEAKEAAKRGEVPVGAVLVGPDGAVLAAAGNQTLAQKDPSAHAEMLVIRQACASLGTERLPEGCALYVTLEPCPMCATAISYARVGRLYYGAEDAKMGGVDHGPRIFASSSCHHRPEVYSGLAAEDAASLLTQFFKDRR